MAFKKGDPKPPGSGRKKGQVNRKSLKSLKQSLADKDFDLGAELLKMLRSDDDQIKLSALRLICQFTHAIPKAPVDEDEEDLPKDEPADKVKPESVSSDNLIHFIKRGEHDDDE